ncbi:phage antirepressor KilAC domain-containing protein [Microbacterium foliorum]|uniref:phage antirepressor KilAC domain-containing protein n=1 Tax=Microbacterium foliorum TaxID=104336 RepID=UPI00099F8CE0|nr:phage antirepressor KilAC domain-containing protein [Microbacterium foliorum]AQY02067.1 hypothetical protein B2G67_11735 [Microbacterium foliorum]
MSALEVFHFGELDMPVRVDMREGEPWFIATDVAFLLGYSEASAMTRTLDDDEKGLRTVQTPGGAQQLAVISEAGLFSAILRSRVPGAKAFKRWVTHEVLPSIRRAGAYVVPENPELLMARAVIQAQELIARKDEQIAVLAPRAEAWDELASAEGDYEVGDAAKILARAGVETGRQRLFTQLAGLGWIYRGAQGKWKARQTAVDSGWLAEKPQSHHHPRSGEVVLDPPQVRVTVRGLERLRVRLGRLELATL